MPGWNNYITKERKLEEELYESRRRVAMLEKKEQERKEEKTILSNMEYIVDKVNKKEPKHKLRKPFVNPQSDKDVRVYLASGNYDFEKKLKYSIYLTCDPKTGEFRLDSKNLDMTEKFTPYMKAVVTVRNTIIIRNDSKLLKDILDVAKEDFPERCKRLERQLETCDINVRQW